MNTHIRKPALPSLSGLRTPLAICIFFFHFTPPHMGPFYPIINTAFAFVGLFFLISGFILTYNYGDRAHTMRDRDFWIARASRLYPVYLFSLLLFGWAFVPPEWHAHSHQDFWLGMILTPLLLQGWFPWLATFWNTVAWTLSADAMLYLAFPWINRIPWPRKKSSLILLVFVLWLVGMVPHTLYLLINPDHLSAPADRYTSTFWIRMVKYTPLPYLCTFLMGVVLAKIHPLITEDRRKRFWMAAIACVSIFAFIYGLSARVPYILEHSGLLTPLFGLLILGLSSEHALTKVFGWGPLVAMGNATYCLYLLHFNSFILIHIRHWPEALHVAQFDPWISYVAILLFALAVNRWIELPMKNVVLGLFKDKKAGPLTKPAAL